jgi:hypothetical protein
MSAYQLEGLAALVIGLVLLLCRGAIAPWLRRVMSAAGFRPPVASQADSAWHKFLGAWPGIVVIVVGLGWTVEGALALLNG